MGALDGTVKVPGLGDTPKKNVVIAGGVVAAIVGVGYYRKRQAALAVATGTGTDTTTDTGGGFSDSVAGPGDLSGGGAVTSTGDPVPAPIVLQNAGILTNNDWKTAGTSLDLGGTDSSVIASALSKVLGGLPITQTEVEIYREVVGEIGDAPQGHPAIKMVLASQPAPSVSSWSYTVQTHQIGAETPARTLIQRFSSPGASGNQIETALEKTVAANPKYKAYYESHGGKYPAQASLSIYVATKK